MRSFNVTCGVTHLPIGPRPPGNIAGQEVRLVLLGLSGSTDLRALAEPLALPIRGVYDGRGGLEQIADDPASRTLLAGVQQVWPDYADLPAFLTAVAGGEVEGELLVRVLDVAPHQLEEVPVDMMFVLEEAYQAIVQAAEAPGAAAEPEDPWIAAAAAFPNLARLHPDPPPELEPELVGFLRFARGLAALRRPFAPTLADQETALALHRAVLAATEAALKALDRG